MTTAIAPTLSPNPSPQELANSIKTILEIGYTSGIDRVLSYGKDKEGNLFGQFEASSRRFEYVIDLSKNKIGYRPVTPSKQDSSAWADGENYQYALSLGFKLDSNKPLFVSGFLFQHHILNQSRFDIKAAKNKAGKELNCNPAKSYPCGARCNGLNKPCKGLPMAEHLKNLAKEVAGSVGTIQPQKVDPAPVPTTTKSGKSKSTKPKPNKFREPKKWQDLVKYAEEDYKEHFDKLSALLARTPREQSLLDAKEKLKAELAEAKQKLNETDDMKEANKIAAQVNSAADKLIKAEQKWLNEANKRIEKEERAMEGLRQAILSRSRLSKEKADDLVRHVSISASALNIKSDKENFPVINRDKEFYNENISEFYRLTNGKGFGSLQEIMKSDDRAYASDFRGLINVGYHQNQDDAKKILFHEMGHHIEFENTQNKDFANSFILERSGGAKPKPLKKLIPGSNYDSDEIARPDKFVSPYVGKIYSDRSTEVISMGMQYFRSADDMASLYKQDPEHFKFMLGIMSL